MNPVTTIRAWVTRRRVYRELRVTAAQHRQAVREHNVVLNPCRDIPLIAVTPKVSR